MRRNCGKTPGRFESGESSYAVRLGLLAALQIVLQRDLAADFARIRSLAAHARSRLGGLAEVNVLEGNDHSGGLVTFLADKMPPATLAAELKKRAINIAAPTFRYTPLSMSRRGFDAINRISPHAFNTMDEIDAAADAIAKLLAAQRNGIEGQIQVKFP